MDTIRARLGDPSQIASAREIRLVDGNEDGVRAVDVRVQGGVHALVLTDRGMDIGAAWFAGQPLAWQSTTGVVHPAYYRDDIWLRSFHGGLLTTCGLQNVGPDNVDAGVAYGQHGRISNIPARNVRTRVILDPLAVEVEGELRETDVYGADLVLRRRLRFPAGSGRVEIADEVENQGFEPTVLMLLYHVNLGYPVVADTSRLVSPAGTVAPLDDASAPYLPEHDTFGRPRPGLPAAVFEHRLADPGARSATIGIVNPDGADGDGLGVAVTFDPTELPRLWRWRMQSPGMYLTGLEPANCTVRGRAADRAAGDLAWLAPGEKRRFHVTIEAAVGPGVAALFRAPAEGAAG